MTSVLVVGGVIASLAMLVLCGIGMYLLLR